MFIILDIWFTVFINILRCGTSVVCVILPFHYLLQIHSVSVCASLQINSTSWALVLDSFRRITEIFLDKAQTNNIFVGNVTVIKATKLCLESIRYENLSHFYLNLYFIRTRLQTASSQSWCKPPKCHLLLACVFSSSSQIYFFLIFLIPQEFLWKPFIGFSSMKVWFSFLGEVLGAINYSNHVIQICYLWFLSNDDSDLLSPGAFLIYTSQ